jgi:uncharacterized protein (DUF1330 family)
MTIDPTAAQFRALRDAQDLRDDEPILVLNLLKFRAFAQYDNDHNNKINRKLSGKEAYDRYVDAVDGLSKTGKAPARVIMMANARYSFIGAQGSTDSSPNGSDPYWDKVLVVRYPSKNHFLGMLREKEYRNVHRHRVAGLEDTRVIVMTASPEGGENSDGARAKL